MDNDTQVCPRCAETIKAQAKVCRFCGHELEAQATIERVQQPIPPLFEEPKASGKSAGRKFVSFLGYLLLIAIALTAGWYLEKEGYLLQAYNWITSNRYAASITYIDARTPVDLREGRVPPQFSLRGESKRSQVKRRKNSKRPVGLRRESDSVGHAAGRQYVNIATVKHEAEQYPDNPNNKYNIGTAYLLQGDYNNALTLLLQAVTLLPHDDQAYANLAVAYSALGNMQQAQNAALSALEYNRDRALAINVLGLVALRQKNDAEALKIFQDGAADHSKNADFLVNLGNLYREQGNDAMAKRTYLKAVACDKECAPAVLNLGTLAYVAENYLEALTYWQQALDTVTGLTTSAVTQLQNNITIVKRKIH